MNRTKSRVTREDVARHAGVSTATVSYVLNKYPKVRESTRDRVLEAVESLGYRPDPIARSMVTKETMQLSIVLNNIANPIYSDMILGFEGRALEHGYFVNICTGQGSIDEYFENFVNRRIDGIFIEALPSKYHIEKVYRLVEAGIKVIMFGHGNADLRKISSVENDYVNAMEKAVDYLWGIGHRRIAYLSGLTVQQSYDLRIEGYQRAMATRSAGQIAEELCICSAKLTNTDISDGKVLAKKLIDRNADASAVICTNDLMAIGALQVFREAGLDVPGDISVLGIDGASFGEIVTPRLTTMGVSYHEIGQKAFGLLYSDLQNNTKGFFRNVPELVIRESTAPPHIHANFGA